MQLELLWNLQELDLSINRLTEEIENTPLLEETREAREIMERLEQEMDREQNKMKEQRRRLKSLELDLQKVSANREALRKKLYGGAVGNIKELETMEKKLSLVEKEQLAIEEVTLGQMESIEELESGLKSMADRIKDHQSLLHDKERQLDAELARLRETLARLGEEREALAGRIEPRYLERYRILCQRHQGRGLARMADDICEGCRVFISSAQRGFLYNPDSIVYCESCGRLLVKLDRQNDAVEQ